MAKHNKSLTSHNHNSFLHKFSIKKSFCCIFNTISVFYRFLKLIKTDNFHISSLFYSYKIYLDVFYQFKFLRSAFLRLSSRFRHKFLRLLNLCRTSFNSFLDLFFSYLDHDYLIYYLNHHFKLKPFKFNIHSLKNINILLSSIYSIDNSKLFVLSLRKKFFNTIHKHKSLHKSLKTKSLHKSLKTKSLHKSLKTKSHKTSKHNKSHKIKSHKIKSHKIKSHKTSKHNKLHKIKLHPIKKIKHTKYKSHIYSKHKKKYSYLL